MQQHTLDAHQGRSVVIDLCKPCQAFWFDTYESLALTPGATLSLFRIIGEAAARPQIKNADVAKCPRCRAGLRRTRDMQRTTKFEYFKCPNQHGRLITFFDFLKEKDFIRPLTPQQIVELRRNVQMVNCSNCGAPIDLGKGGECEHCGTPVSMLDINQAEKLVNQLRNAENRSQRLDPARPFNPLYARREVEKAFREMRGDDIWFQDVSASGLVSAGLHVLAGLLTSDD